MRSPQRRGRSARAHRSSQTTALPFDAIAVEGSLIAPAMLARIADRSADAQAEADYGVPKGLTLRDEIARYFRIGQALYRDLHASPEPSTAATVRFVQALLRDVFGFADIRPVGTRTRDEHVYAVTLEALGGRVPVVVVPPTDRLDAASEHLPGDGRRRSAASAVQDWLNSSDDALWGLCCNGRQLRLLRDNASLTRPAHIEADLHGLFDGEAFADFAALWLLIHASRFGTPDRPATDCALERWREAGGREGTAARERLRDGVETALLALGGGFLGHPGNEELRARLRNGSLPLPVFFGQLLRLVYRLIFLLAAEDRGLLHPPETPPAARRLYADGYAVGALRDRAVRRAAWDRHHDRWEGLLIVFSALARGERRLGLPALGGIFAPGTVPDLEHLRLANRDLMQAIYRLAWLSDADGTVPVNWRDMETEELGSVYESLLELTPQLTDDGRGFAFAEGAETKGNARKTSGSYYTPDSLVQTLLDSALDPVLDRAEAEAEDSAAALLSVTVIDPACGSGHFLLAAARRIATRLARARTGGVASPDDYRHALRDVARACIHGVDRNPMAVELTKVALWIETVEPGKPLGFLDANIRCGDALLGVFDLDALRKGIPDAAYKPLTGDDRETARHFAKRNVAERDGQGSLDFSGGGGRMPAAAPLAREAEAVRAMPEDSPEQIAAKRSRFDALRSDGSLRQLTVACDLYMAAFLVPKTGGVPVNHQAAMVPTTGHVWDATGGGTICGPLLARSQHLAREAGALHWPLEFPDIMAAGGFDVVLGNPPWERIKLQEQEFFAAHDPEIANALNASERGRMIAALRQSDPESRQFALHRAFEVAKRTAESSSAFSRVPVEQGGRFALTGRGDVNTYALFAELFSVLPKHGGRSGVIVPTGIATDATTASFFAALVDERRLFSLHDFQTGLGFFDRIGHARFKFCLLTVGRPGSAGRQVDFSFFSRTMSDFKDPLRHFTLTADEISNINPNTKTAPVFRSRVDAELTAKIHARIPVLINETKIELSNPWCLDFHSRIWHMAEDSSWFRSGAQLSASGYTRDRTDWVLKKNRDSDDKDGGSSNVGGDEPEQYHCYSPLYEAKMIHQFDHRAVTYDGVNSREVLETEKINPDFEPSARYWVPEVEVTNRLKDQGWTRNWLMGWRDICRSTDERTVIANVVPRTAFGHTYPLCFAHVEPQLAAAFLANICSLVLDFVARLKIGGTHLTLGYLKQLPILAPSIYGPSDLNYIVPRVVELTYTSRSMAPFARDLGFEGPPFIWNENRREWLRAELDAWYARAYGLTRDELRYVLDPADVKGLDYPSETFRVLKKNEIARYGEYRTARLVLAAWDRLEREQTEGVETRKSVERFDRLPRHVDLASLPNEAWKSASTGPDAALAQLAALILALPGPTPIANVRMAALYAMEPRYLTRRLTEADRATWCRLIGSAAELLPTTNIPALTPRIDASWRNAVTQLRGMGAIVEDAAAQTWAAGPALAQFDVDRSAWPFGRAVFVLRALASIPSKDALAELPAEDVGWASANAA